MKAISLWQPWASAMASGNKQNETRSWPTSYRGDLLICSSKRKPTPEEVGSGDYNIAMGLPYGCALCVVELVNCVPTQCFHGNPRAKLSNTERELGDYTPGRFAWLTKNLRTLRRPIPIVGRQGLWNVDEQTLDAVRAQL